MREVKAQIKRFWKLIVALVVVIAVSAIGMMAAKAQTVVLTVSSSAGDGALATTEWTKDHSEVWTVTTSGIDSADSSKIIWKSDNVNVIALGTSRKDTATGNVNDIVAMGAGRATVTIQYVNGDDMSAPQVFTFVVGLQLTSSLPNGFLFLDSSSYVLSTNYIGDDLIWSSSDETVAKVVGGARGTATVIDGGSGGSTVITGITPDLSQSVSVTVITKTVFEVTTELDINPEQIVDLRDYTNVKTENSIVAVSDNENYVKSNGTDKIVGMNAGLAYVYIYPNIDYSLCDAYKEAKPAELAAAFGDVKLVRTSFGIRNGDQVGTVGNTIQLSVNVTDEDAKGVQWSSSNNRVASVDANGVVTMVAADDGYGQNYAYITATLDSTEIFAGERIHTSKIKVTVVDSFALSESSHIMNAGESFELEALVTDKNAEVKWEIISGQDIIGIAATENPYKITVNGLIKGTARIKATQVTNGVAKYAYCDLDIKEPVQNVNIEEKQKTVNKGATERLYFAFEPSRPDNMEVLWVSSDEKIVQVEYTEGNTYVELKGINGGDAVVYVVTTDGIKIAQCDVHIRIPVTGVTISETKVETSFTLGKYQLTSTVLPEGDGVDRSVSWKSTNEAILKVDETGMVTFVSPGKASVICQTNDTDSNNINALATCEFYIKVPVDSIKLNSDELVIRVGSTKKLLVDVLPETADDKTVKWLSTNPLVATVDENGKVTAVASGTTAILVTSNDGGKMTSCSVTVHQPVTSISLSKSKMKVKKGTTFYLSAKLGPSNAYNKNIKWRSTNEKIATVTSDGKVKAISLGKCNIIATSNDSGLYAACEVEVIKSVTGVKLNYYKKTINAGDKFKLVATVLPSTATNKKVSYTSSNPKAAKISKKGIVTGVAGGKAIITVVTDDGGLEAVCYITVKQKVSSVNITNKIKQMNIGTEKQLKVQVKPSTATNRKVKWTTSNKKVIRVSSNGKIKAVGYGWSKITAVAKDGSGKKSSVAIRVIEPVKKINVSPSAVVLLEGEEKQIKAAVKPHNATFTDINWTSSDPSIAVVDYDGRITAISAGLCYVYATSTDGNNVKGIVKVTVKTAVPATEVKINAKEINLLPGQSKSLSYKVTPANSTDAVRWVSSDASVVRISKSGLAVAKGQGNAVIYAITDSGVEVECPVNVLAMNSTSINVEQYDDYQLEVYGATDKVSWFTNNRRIATIDNTGKVVGRKIGTTTITAKANGKLLYCRVSVKKVIKK